MRSLHLEPLIAPALWIALAVVSVLLLAWYARTRPASMQPRRWVSVLLLTALGLAAVFIVLLNPTWIEPIAPPAGKPLLTILVDSSASMAAPDEKQSDTRYVSATKMAEDVAKEMDDRYEVRVRRFEASVIPEDVSELENAKPDGELSDLSGALRASIDDDRPQGQMIVLLSDGIHNGLDSGREVVRTAAIAKAMAAPIFTRTFGDNTEVRDLAVRLRSSQELSFVGQRIPIVARVDHRGLAGGQVTLLLEEDNNEIDRQQVQLVTDQTAEAHFEVQQDEGGLHRYQVRALEFPGEVTEINNRATFLLRVVDKPLRVLFLEGKPYWDSKFLMRTLASDPAVELESIVKLTENRLLHRTLKTAKSGTPENSRREEWMILDDASTTLTDPEALGAYQVIVLGRDAEAFLHEDALLNLRQWITREGGALVCYRGSPVAQLDQRLASMLPVRWTPGSGESRFHLQLTERGQELNWFADLDSAVDPFSFMPTLSSVTRVDDTKPLTVVLASTVSADANKTQAAISYQPYGTGRVVVVEGAGMWRWAFLPPKYQEHDDTYRSLWQSLLRWLASSTGLLPGQEMALQCMKTSFGTLDTCTASLLVREEGQLDPSLRVQLNSASLDEPQTFSPVPVGDEPGTFQIVFGQLPEGQYRLNVVSDNLTEESAKSITAAFEVHRFLGEQLDLQARPDLMQHIADASGGGVIEGDDAGEAMERFEQQLAESRMQRVQRITTWDRWWILLAVFAIWGATWGLRRSGGLI